MTLVVQILKIPLQGTEIDRSCSITWQNQHYVFGGTNEKTQISKIVGCGLTKIGDLDFDHYYGACSNMADEKIYLCFNDANGDKKVCRMATSPTGNFSEIDKSVYRFGFHYIVTET